MDNKKYCRVCGLYQGEDCYPWGIDDRSPTFDICSCCGVEFGYEDCSLESTKNFRFNWLVKGAIWFKKNKMPSNWSLEEQLKNIPEKFR